MRTTETQVRFDFRQKNGRSCEPAEWLRAWEDEYPSEDYDEKYYDYLIRRAGVLSSEDFVLIGRWKDSAWTEKRWRPNVAMVAYPAWVAASEELPGVRIEGIPLEPFLKKWSDRRYPDTSSRSADGQKRFGLSRTTTLVHFMSTGRLPIYDSRVRIAVKRLCDTPAPDDVESYLEFFVPIFDQLVGILGASARSVDKALFAYGRV
jgi:hypothetical protein